MSADVEYSSSAFTIVVTSGTTFGNFLEINAKCAFAVPISNFPIYKYVKIK
jgi:hypothetical protein